MDTNQSTCIQTDAPICSNKVTNCEYSESSVDDGRNRNYEDRKIIECHLFLNKEGSSLADIIQRKSLKTLAEMKRNKEEFVKSTVEKLKTADYFDCLESMIAAGIRPNVVAKFNAINFILYSTILNCVPDTYFEYETVKYIELSLDRISPKSYKLIYKWMIIDKPIQVQCSDLLDLIDCWTYLYRNIGTDRYYHYIFDKSLMNLKAFLMFWETRRRNYKYGHLFLNNRIKECFLYLVANIQYVQLDIKEVCILLSSSSIGVNSEIETFMAAVRWLNHDWKARKQHTNKIMECIRFQLMAPYLLIPLIQDESEEVRRVVSIYSVLNSINKDKDHDGCRTLELLNRFVAPLPRFWIYDKDCSYHNKLGSQNLNAFGYEDFLKYLSELKKKGRGMMDIICSIGFDEFKSQQTSISPSSKQEEEVEISENTSSKKQ